MKIIDKTRKRWQNLLSLPVILFLISGCQHQRLNANTEIPVYVYHEFSPFVIQDNSKADLSRLFISKLRQETGLNWVLHPIARSDLNKRISQKQPVTILWANPKWFKQQANLLVSHPILWDADVIVYHPDRPINGSYPDAFNGKSFCAVEGHIYRHLIPLLAQQKITQVSEKFYQTCVDRLLNHQVDFIQLEKSQILNVYQHQLHKQIEMFQPNVDSFTRHMLISPSYSSFLPQINHVIQELANDPQWQQDLTLFGEKNFINLFDMELVDLLKIQPTE